MIWQEELAERGGRQSQNKFFTNYLEVPNIYRNFVPDQTYAKVMRLIRTYTLLLLICIVATCRANNLGYTKNHQLVFGIDMDYPPLEFVGDKGTPSGLDIEFTKRLMNRLNIPFTFSPNTWEKISDDVLQGNVDLAMMVYSPYRKNLTNYSRGVFRLYYQLVYRMQDKASYGLRDLNGKEIALLPSRPISDTLQNIGAKPIIINDLRQALLELSQGKYDALICFRYQTRYLIDELGIKNLTSSDLALMPREYCYVSHDKRLIDSINSELDRMEAEGEIEDVYGNIKTTFDGTPVPMWVWLLIAGVIIFLLVTLVAHLLVSRKRLKQEMNRAKKSEELKDIFLSNLSHSLRTPLNAIIGFSELMLEDSGNNVSLEERRGLLEIINKNGLQLLHLINELLSLSDIEGKSQLFDRMLTDIDELMNNCANEARMQANEGVTVEVVRTDGGLRAMLDPKLLRLVTMHLLENAVQHTTEGKVTLNYYAKNNGFYLEVKDTGSGLPEKLKENIFALLSDKNTYTQEDTPGLGLSICKAVIDKAEGQIGARDNEVDGRGTIVWFWTPAKIIQ